MRYIVIFSTHWGYQEGGINSFNYDFATALGRLSRKSDFKVVCITLHDTLAELATDAQKNKVRLYSLNKSDPEFSLQDDIEGIKNIIRKLKGPSLYYFVGHDVFTGEIANYLLQEFRSISYSIIFHHMDYEAYYGIKGDVTPDQLNKKIEKQKEVLNKSSIIISVGPLLKESAREKTTQQIEMILPGLQKIEPWPNFSRKMIAITFGRYDERTDRLKQMRLAAKAFATFSTIPNTEKRGTLKIIGLDNKEDAEELKRIATEDIAPYINILCLPYKTNRSKLLNELRQAGVCMMLSVHDGFGLVGLEAIAAGIPLILSENSGLYDFLVSEIGLDRMRNYGLFPVRINGSNIGAIDPTDLSKVVVGLKDIRDNRRTFRQGVLDLRKILLAKYTWESSAASFMIILNQKLKKKNSKEQLTDLKPVKTYQFRLPPSYSVLIGRYKEVEKIKNAYTSRTTNIISIVAWGGVGKTSLVKLWLASLPLTQRPNVFEWSFYSQGSGNIVVSSEIFFEKAFLHFGDMNHQKGTVSERATRLANLIDKKRAILILDGLEPVQHPGPPLKGYIKDAGIRVLIEQLSICRHVFCIITSREIVKDLSDKNIQGHMSINLKNLDLSTAIKLLQQFKLTGNKDEFKKAAQYFDKHALSLILLGNWLHKVEGGLIGSYFKVPLFKEDTNLGNPAFRMMRSYDNWLPTREKQFIRLLGFFNRPASKEEIDTLLSDPIVKDMNDLLPRPDNRNEDRRRIQTYLRDQYLIASIQDDQIDDIDTHPLIREYQQLRLKENIATWVEGNRRLYYYLSRKAPEFPNTIYGIIQLYTAAQHGCLAGLHEEVFKQLFEKRIWRGYEYYSTNQLGLLEDELEVLTHFFETPFNKLHPNLSTSIQAHLYSQTGFCLRSSLRLKESITPYEKTLEIRVAGKEWQHAVINACNLSQLHLYLGNINKARQYGESAIEYSQKFLEKPMLPVWRTAPYTNLAMTFLESGNIKNAFELFNTAEALLYSLEKDASFLYSARGYQQCEYLIATIEADVWKYWFNDEPLSFPENNFEKALKIATYGLEKANTIPFLQALYNLILSKLSILKFAAGGEPVESIKIETSLDKAEKQMVQAHIDFELPRIYITKSSLFRCLAYKNYTNSLEAAHKELEKADKIVRYSKLALHRLLLEIEKTRLYITENKNKRIGPPSSLLAAKNIVDKYGYLRYKNEVQDLTNYFGKQSD